MKKTILLLSALALLTTACKKKKDETTPSSDKEVTSDYYFTGKKGGVDFSYKENVNDYDDANGYSGSETVSGSDTTFFGSYDASVQYASFDDPSGDVPYFSLVTDYDAVGINNATNLALAFPIGTHNIDEDTYVLNYYKTSDPGTITIGGSGDYYSKNRGSITFTEVTYLGTEEFFSKLVKKYKVKGTVDTYIYNDNDATDSVKVEAEFSLLYESKSY